MRDLSSSETRSRSPLQGFMPFFWLSMAALLGVIIADWLNMPPWLWPALVLITILVFILAWKLPKSFAITHQLRTWINFDRRLPGIFLAMMFFTAAWRYDATRSQIDPGQVAFYNDRGRVRIIGTVDQLPVYHDHITNLVVKVEKLQIPGEETPGIIPDAITGKVLLQVQPGSEWAYGMRLRATGDLITPGEIEDFSYSQYLARKGIWSLMQYAYVDRVEFGAGNPIKAFIYDFQPKANAVLQSIFPSPESDLLGGILLGFDQGLSPGLQEAFRVTGTTHIIAISGFNIAILAGLFSSIFTRFFGRVWGALISIAAISAYTLLVGGDAAVVRAAIMGVVGVMGGMFGRRQNGLNSLGLAVLAMAMINPDIAWDIGFQLSVGATLGLVLFAQPLEEHFITLASRKMPEEQAHKLVAPVSEFFLFTLAAQVMTLPIMAYHFGGISWLALITNPLILPVQPPVMILGGVSLMAGLVSNGLGRFFATISLPFVRYTINMVTWLSRLSAGDLILPDFHWLWLLVFYALLFTLTLLPKDQRVTLRQKCLSHHTVLLVLSGMIIFIWNQVLSTPDSRLHLTLLDAQGTILIQSPTGNTALIGAGPRPSHLNQALGQMLPARKRNLDAIIVGSTARDDLNALTGPLKTARIGTAYWTIKPDVNRTTSTVYALTAEKAIPIVEVETGQILDLGDGVTLEFLWIGERGTLLWLEWENFSALLPSGRVNQPFKYVPSIPNVVLLPDNLTIEDLQLGLINTWSPAVILFPLDTADLPWHGEHPLSVIFAEFPLVTTLEHGWVRVSTDGNQLWVTTER